MNGSYHTFDGTQSIKAVDNFEYDNDTKELKISTNVLYIQDTLLTFDWRSYLDHLRIDSSI